MTKVPKYLSDHHAVASVRGYNRTYFKWEVRLKDGYAFNRTPFRDRQYALLNNKSDFEFLDPVDTGEENV